jgi:hypothetical protein
MDTVQSQSWSFPDYCLKKDADLADPKAFDLARTVYERFCRTDFDNPGFCLIDLGRNITSSALRQWMVALKQQLQRIHRERAERDLIFLSAARFDQQVTTKLHRDGGPDESLLILGYEPSSTVSEVRIADYSQCAYDMGMTPDEFMERHNPMFGPGEKLLLPYTTRIACFANEHSQVLLVNNSGAPFAKDNPRWQGVLHTATMSNPAEVHRRVINSTMAASVPMGTPESVSAMELAEFLSTTLVRRRGYDKPELHDDV